MLIQLHLNPADTRAIKAYRLQVKERLYRFNYVSMGIYMTWIRLTGPCLQEVLVQLEDKERLEKLEETFQTVYGDYQRILAMVR